MSSLWHTWELCLQSTYDVLKMIHLKYARTNVWLKADLETLTQIYDTQTITLNIKSGDIDVNGSKKTH